MEYYFNSDLLWWRITRFCEGVYFLRLKASPTILKTILFSCCDECDVEHPLENCVFLYIFCLTLFLAFFSYIAFSCVPSTPILLNASRAFSCIAACCFIQPYVFTPDPIMLTGPQIFSLPRNDRYSLPAVGPYCSS